MSAWPSVPLGQIVDRSISYGVLKPSEHTPGGVPMLRIQDITNYGTRADTSLHCITAAQHHEYRRTRLRSGDLIYSVVGSLGRCMEVPESLAGANVSRAFCVIGISEKSARAWVKQYLTSAEVEHWLTKTAMGNAQKVLNMDALARLEIPMPHGAERDATVAILQIWDQGIAAAEDLVIASGSHVSGLTSRHLDAFIPGTAREDTSLPLVALKDAFDERDETGNEGEPLLAITGERGVVPRDEIERRDTSAEDKGAYRLILPGDIGYNTMRMWQGVCGLSAYRGIVSPAYTVVTPRPNVMDGAFAAALFKAPHMIEWLRRYSQGIVDDTLNLKFEQFRQIRVRLPSLETQRRVANAIHAIRAEAEVTARLAMKLRDQKQALMSRLLSGSLRVPLKGRAKPSVAEAANA